MYRSIAKLLGSNSLSESILTPPLLFKIMRGRWAAAAIGAGVARRRASNEYSAQNEQAQQQIEAQQRQIEALQQQKQQPQPQPQPQQEDVTQKLKKYGDLKQQGILTEEEFRKLKADLLSKM